MIKKLLNKIYSTMKNIAGKIYQFIKQHPKISIFITAIIIITLILLSYSTSDDGLSQEIIDKEKDKIEIEENNNNKELSELQRELLLIEEELIKLNKESINKENQITNKQIDKIINKYKYIISEQ